MIRIASGMIGVVVASVCWNAGGAVAKDIEIPTHLGELAKSTGSYISQARACKTDEWKLALRESIKEVQKRRPGSDLRYFQLVVEWANRLEARDCDQERLLTAKQYQRIDLDSFMRNEPGLGCSLSPRLVC